MVKNTVDGSYRIVCTMLVLCGTFTSILTAFMMYIHIQWYNKERKKFVSKENSWKYLTYTFK